MHAENSNATYILTVNAGSSSIKIALFDAQNITKKMWGAAIQNIGSPSASLHTSDGARPIPAPTYQEAAALLTKLLGAQVALARVVMVGSRIVHGGPNYHKPSIATNELLEDLQNIAAFDPQHLPVQLELVTAFKRALPHAQHALCFDTAFHYDLPTQSRLLPLPRHLEAKGIRRYGFHGLSYAYIVDELRRVEGDAAANGKVVIAHLGSGASLAALHHGKPIDTTMSMTPASGIPMGTRSGDVDPGLMLYLAETQGYNAERFNHMANFESGLLGISGTTADMEKLLQIETEDTRAKDAVDIFCYHVKKTIGAYAAALGGLNTLVFTGGMGESAPDIRARVCEGLEFLGITIQAARNHQNARLISAADGNGAGVHVIHTDEAATIARQTAELLKNKGLL